MQLMAFFLVYLLGGVGCAVFALLRCGRSNPLDLLSMVLLWPLCAPFLFASTPGKAEPERGRRPPEEQMQVLARHCEKLISRLVEIDAVLSQEDWSREQMASKRADLDKGSGPAKLAMDALSVRLEHIERLHFLRKVHADELEDAQALLDQMRSQAQLSRFLEPREGDEMPHLADIRERIADSELMLASETELIALCHESL